MDDICYADGCERPKKLAGLCGMHHALKLRNGDPNIRKRAAVGEPERFYQEVVLPYDGHDCLHWPYGKTTAGYGVIGIAKKSTYVHRRLCEEIHGPPPTPEHEAAHSCGKGHEACVSRSHLSWKTSAENKADKLDHGTMNRGERCGTSKLTENQVREIRSLKGKMTQAAVAEMFGINKWTAMDIQNRKSWAWLED